MAVPASIPDVPKPTDKEKLLKLIKDTLVEYNNQEASIPPGHAYWDNVNRYRGL